MRRIPFEVWSVHHDNGKEYVNNAIAKWRGDRWKMPFSRSRPNRKNDNAHVEQKNGSVVRTLLGESRLDRRELEPELRRLCEDYSGYRNFCVPCKMLVAKTKRKDGKGFSCRYDKPRTPYARVLADPAVPENAKNALRRRKEKLNGIELYQRILKRLRRIRRMQDLPDGDSPGPVSSALAPCGATPSGTAFASEAGAEQHRIASHQPNPSEKCPAFDKRNVQALNQRVSILFDELGPFCVFRKSHPYIQGISSSSRPGSCELSRMRVGAFRIRYAARPGPAAIDIASHYHMKICI